MENFSFDLLDSFSLYENEVYVTVDNCLSYCDSVLATNKIKSIIILILFIIIFLKSGGAELIKARVKSITR